MWDKLFARLTEPSTYAGLGVMFLGANEAFDFNEAPVIAEGLNNAGAAIAAGMPWWQAGLLAGFGILATFKSEGK